MRVVVGVLALLGSACGPSVASGLRDARDAGAPPAELVVRWAEPAGPLGGQELVLSASREGGVLHVRRFRPGFLPGEDAPETRLTPGGALEAGATPGEAAEHVVGVEALLELVALLLEVEAWKGPAASNLGPPLDAREATLELAVDGSHSVTRVAVADLGTEARLVRVRDALLRLAGEG